MRPKKPTWQPFERINNSKTFHNTKENVFLTITARGTLAVTAPVVIQLDDLRNMLRLSHEEISRLKGVRKHEFFKVGNYDEQT